MTPPLHDYFDTWLPHTYYSTSSGFAPSIQEQDESKSFYPKDCGKFCFTFGLFGKGGVSFLSQGMSPMLGFLLRGCVRAEPAPVQPFWGKLFHEGDNKPMFIPQDQYRPDCAEPLGHI